MTTPLTRGQTLPVAASCSRVSTFLAFSTSWRTRKRITTSYVLKTRAGNWWRLLRPGAESRFSSSPRINQHSLVTRSQGRGVLAGVDGPKKRVSWQSAAHSAWRRHKVKPQSPIKIAAKTQSIHLSGKKTELNKIDARRSQPYPGAWSKETHPIQNMQLNRVARP